MLGAYARAGGTSMWLLVIVLVLFVVLPVATGFWLQHAAARQEQDTRVRLEAAARRGARPDPAERWPA